VTTINKIGSRYNFTYFIIDIYTEEEFEDTKVVIRICKSKKNRQHNGQKKKYKRTNNDLLSTEN
jgi:hypothetical protein